MMQISLDGKRLYVTTSFLRVWDTQFHPEMIKFVLPTIIHAKQLLATLMFLFSSTHALDIEFLNGKIFIFTELVEYFFKQMLILSPAGFKLTRISQWILERNLMVPYWLMKFVILAEIVLQISFWLAKTIVDFFGHGLTNSIRKIIL